MNHSIQWSPGVSLEAVERQVIQKAFDHFRQNKTATAGALGIAIRTLENKLAKYALDDSVWKEANERRKQDANEFLARARGLTPAQNATPANGPYGSSAQTGLRMESVANAATEQTLSMPERREVQEMLPKQAAQGNNGKRR
jgi:Bacterial regulatory protein, Fis family